MVVSYSSTFWLFVEFHKGLPPQSYRSKIEPGPKREVLDKIRLTCYTVTK